MILAEIIANKKRELPLNSDFGELTPSRRSLAAHLKGRNNLIAEIKRRSPSAGQLREVDLVEVTRLYERYAAAISVLTDERYFGGSLADLTRVRALTALPVLRKDFIIHESQLAESRAAGADAVLLIVSLLSPAQLREFLSAAAALGLDCLVEVRTPAEAEQAVGCGAQIIGINNRDLATFKVDLARTRELRELIPPDRLVVGESGYTCREEIAAAGTNAVLIGTALMRAPSIARALELLTLPKVKICGITNLTDAQQAVDAGADWLGFNFVEASPRYMTPAAAGEISRQLPNSVACAGVFVDADPETVRQTTAVAGLDLLQFHGEEDPAYCAGFELPVVKAFRVQTTAPEVEEYRLFGRLFDSYDPQRHGGTGQRFNSRLVERIPGKIFLAGGLDPDNLGLVRFRPFAFDVASGVEVEPGRKDHAQVMSFIRRARDRTRFGRFGGRFVPETLMPALAELDQAYRQASIDPGFQTELNRYLEIYAGRPTPLYPARNLSKDLGCQVLLKREDLLHGGAHKTNNVLGQALLARRMGKQRLVAETGAGQHGIAVAMAGALFELQTEIYMGVEDMERQRLNVQRMELCGARVIPAVCLPGRDTLKDAISDALRDWTTNVESTYYLLGSVAGPHPYPALVGDFQRVIGEEARRQVLQETGRLPSQVVACVGGGSNAIGIFSAFLEDPEVALVGVEAGGEGDRTGATLALGSEGVFQGALTYLLQDDDGQVREAHSIAPGLDYPGVGPQHSHLQQTGRASYERVTDREAVAAFEMLSRREGIIPALESAHAVAWVLRSSYQPEDIVIINLSGRGDKDLATITSGTAVGSEE